jgi:pimeloyl-ACP methyl ester carboxylesterase
MTWTIRSNCAFRKASRSLPPILEGDAILARSAEEYDKNVQEFLYQMYAYRRGCEVEPGTPEQDVHGLMFPPTTGNEAARDGSRTLDATAAPGLWLRMPRPKTLPKWLMQQDLDYLVEEFERAGFHGSLCWYRALDRNFQLMKEALQNGRLVDDKIQPPSLFLTGEQDGVVKLYVGKRKVIERLKANLPNLTREPIFLNDCGHWIQQEYPSVVNDALLQFFDDVLHKENKRFVRNSKL